MIPRIPSFLEIYEWFWNMPKILPHYEFVGRPFYKLLGGNKRPQLAVPATFFLMDLLFHQVFAQVVKDYEKGRLSPNTLLKINLFQSFVWTSLSLPIVYIKLKRNKLAAEQMNQPGSHANIVPPDIVRDDKKSADLKNNSPPFFTEPPKKKRKKRGTANKTMTDEQMANSVFAIKKKR